MSALTVAIDSRTKTKQNATRTRYIYAFIPGHVLQYLDPKQRSIPKMLRVLRPQALRQLTAVGIVVKSFPTLRGQIGMTVKSIWQSSTNSANVTKLKNSTALTTFASI